MAAPLTDADKTKLRKALAPSVTREKLDISDDASLNAMVKAVSEVGLVLPVAAAAAAGGAGARSATPRVEDDPGSTADDEEELYRGVDPTPLLFREGESVSDMTRAHLRSYQAAVRAAIQGVVTKDAILVESYMREWDRLRLCSSRTPMSPPEKGLVWEKYVIEIDATLAKLNAASLPLSPTEQKEAQARRDKAKVHKRKFGTYPPPPDALKEKLAAALGLTGV